MDFQKELNSNSSFLKIKRDISEYDVNDNFIAISDELDLIEIYSVKSFKKLFSYKVNLGISNIKFHPKYYNIFSITLNCSRIHLLHINSKKNLIEKKFEYLCSKENSLEKTIFSLYDDGKYLATISTIGIKIWRIDKYNYINNIKTNLDKTKLSNFQFRWSDLGNYLIFPKNRRKIEIFSLSSGTIEYNLNSNANDLYLLEKSSLIIIIKDIFIKIWDLKNNNEIFEFKHDASTNIKSNYDYFNKQLYLLNYEKLFIYDIDTRQKIFEKENKDIENFFLLKNRDDNQNIFSKLIFYNSEKNGFEILSIFSNNIKQKNSFILEEASDDFWKDSVNKIYNDYDYLSYINNQKEDEEIFTKNYFAIDEIKKELEYLLKNKTLEERRVFDDNNMIVSSQDDQDKNIVNIYNIYLNYIKNIIRDNTNIDLLTNYLNFIRTNKTVLSEKFGDKFETFEKEINQFQVCFSKTMLIEKLNYDKKLKSEHQKLLEFLKEFSLLDFDNMEKNDFNNYINSKKQELENFRFNQPISFCENSELYFCKIKIGLIYNIKKIIEKEKYKILKNMKYCVEEVLNRNFLIDDHILKNNIYLNCIIILISVPQRKIITDYNLNLIDNKDIDVNVNELKKLGFQYNKIEDIYENNDIIIKNDENEIKLYNLKNLKLFINSQNEYNFKQHELYKFDELKKYYSNKFDEEKVRIFISKILASNVMEEAFSFFYGEDIKYPFEDKIINNKEKKALEFVNNYIEFIPLKNEETSAVTDKFSMQTYIFVNQDLVTSNVDDIETEYSIDKEFVNKVLVNGAIVSINDHELNHNFHNYYYFSKNGNEPLKTPRKKEMDERESGNNMERVLFGRLINQLTLKQVFYILNEDNYKKSLNQFRAEFMELKDEDCKCEGIFKEYSIITFDEQDISDYISINFKINYINTKKIKIKIKNDVLGFPNF